MASRRDPRLPNAGNSLAEAEIRVSDNPQPSVTHTSADPYFVPALFIPGYPSTVVIAGGAPSRAPGARSRIVIETNHGSESCLPSYTAQLEALDDGSKSSNSAPAEPRHITLKIKSTDDQGLVTNALAINPITDNSQRPYESLLNDNKLVPTKRSTPTPDNEAARKSARFDSSTLATNNTPSAAAPKAEKFFITLTPPTIPSGESGTPTANSMIDSARQESDLDLFQRVIDLLGLNGSTTMVPDGSTTAVQLEAGAGHLTNDVTLTVQDCSAPPKFRSHLQSQVDAGRLVPLDYSQLCAEVLPAGYTDIAYLSTDEEKRDHQLRHLGYRLQGITSDNIQQLIQSGQLQNMLDIAKADWPMFPRVFNPKPLKKSRNAPPSCRPRSAADAWPDDLPSELLESLLTKYLSHGDVRNLRLVNKPMCASVSPIYFRNLVTRFGVGMYSPSHRYGDYVNKFGISFEVDLPSLYHATTKVFQETQQSWWGNYNWPKPVYQRFPELEALEELVDDHKPLLKKTLANLPKASELGLSIDSGHGWLNGPDMSDMQVWESRNHGSKVFGNTFKTTDKWEEHLRNELFRWAQQNTINQSIKYLVEKSTTESPMAFNRTQKKLRWLKGMRVRDYESFERESEQSGYDDHHHTGGPPRPAPNQNQAAQNQPGAGLYNGPAMNHNQLLPAAAPGFQVQQGAQPGMVFYPHVPGTAAPPARDRRLRSERQRVPASKPGRRPYLPQWPLIFNGYNLAAELGGQNSYVQDKIALPASALLHPGHLSEAQAQWLMETFWAQRAFLSAYTTSVILNTINLRHVHTLTIAKLSSGLLPLLEQHEFWRALPGLRDLTILISPDWRQEHIPGDRSFQTNMLISPTNASIKLAGFLQRFICSLENLSKLTVGFVGGGEHASGMLARNQHVLPAPITQNPREWVSDYRVQPNVETMISFNHIKDLKFENCWVSPCMLRGFMEKSRDSSLRHLVLDSVSLTANNAAPNASGVADPIEAQYGREAWLNETLPNAGCWPAVLDSITPGLTFLEQQEAVGFYMSEQSEDLLRNKSFRGNVQEITLKSCGYVHISGVMVDELNQSELLRAKAGALDEGLISRHDKLQVGQSPPRSRRHRPAPPGNANPPPALDIDPRPCAAQDIPSRLMMSTNDANGHEYFGLGTLTQAVHPVEKRVLEQAWSMTFGWGNDMKRWSAVDDGFFEGGTGRFSGTILK